MVCLPACQYFQRVLVNLVVHQIPSHPVLQFVPVVLVHLFVPR